MSISINGSLFKGVSALGSSAPEAGYYAVSVLELEQKAGDKTDARRLHVQFDTGFKMFQFVHLPVAGLPEKSLRGRLGAIKTILHSLGYNDEQIEGGEIDDAWFVTSANGGRKAYVEFVPGQQGVQGSYATINKFMGKVAFEAAVASGVKPTVAQFSNGGGGGLASAPSVPMAAPSAPVSVAVAPVPAGGLRLPPPPSANIAR
jgi:hypothetical protein